MIEISPILQKPNWCGPACLAMIANFYGIKTTQEQMAKVAETSDNGTELVGMQKATQFLGLKFGYQDNASLEQLKDLSRTEIPIIVDWFCEVTGHYSIVVKMDEENIYLRDPILSELRIMTLKEFEDVWFDFEGDRPEKNSFFVRRIIVIRI